LVIGGSAMLFYAFSKTATNDIDIVSHNEEDRKHLVNVLEKAGFKKESSPKESGEPYRFSMKDYSLNVFAEDIHGMKTSPGLLGRIKEKVEFGGLTISVIAPEDIILTKCVTDRKGDREDAMGIIKEYNVKWDLVLQEARWQTENGDKAFTVYLYDFLEDLKEMGAEVPKEVLRKVRKISEEEMLKVLKSKRGNVSSK
jgi:predicted nucleotidyltransferase